MENPPSDLKIIQIAPEELLKSGISLDSSETIIQDYRHGAVMGMRYLYENRKG